MSGISREIQKSYYCGFCHSLVTNSSFYMHRSSGQCQRNIDSRQKKQKQLCEEISKGIRRNYLTFGAGIFEKKATGQTFQQKID